METAIRSLVFARSHRQQPFEEVRPTVVAVVVKDSKEGDREAILRCWAFSRVQSSAVQSQLDRTKQNPLD